MILRRLRDLARGLDSIVGPGCGWVILLGLGLSLARCIQKSRIGFFFPISLEMIEDHEMLMYNFKLKKKLYHELFGINDERTLYLNLFVRKQVFPRVK